METKVFSERIRKQYSTHIKICNTMKFNAYIKHSGGIDLAKYITIYTYIYLVCIGRVIQIKSVKKFTPVLVIVNCMYTCNKYIQ